MSRRETLPAPPAAAGSAVDDLELDLFIEGVRRRFGQDLRHYAPAFLLRRIRSELKAAGLASISALQERVLRDPLSLQRLLQGFAGRRTGMFDDPDLLRFLRDEAVPRLRTYPHPRVWLVGCGSGEAAYGMAVLLAEGRAIERCHVYATDTDPEALALARLGLYPAAAVRRYGEALQAAGGTVPLSDFFTPVAGQAQVRPDLRKQVVFADHHLATDTSFNEFHLIVCRDALRYGSEAYRARAYGVFHASLPMFGMLAVGRMDGFKDNPHGMAYQGMAGWKHVYRRIR